MFVRVLCTSRSIGVGRGALRIDRTACSENGRLFRGKDVSGTSLTRLRSRMNDSGCRLIVSRDSLHSCGLRLGRLLRLSNARRVSLILPRLTSRRILRPLPTRRSICRRTLTSHPRVRDDGLDVRGSGLSVSITGTNCLPAVDLDTSAKDVAGDTDSGD